MRNKRRLLLSIAGLAVCLVAAVGMTGCGSQSEEAAAPEETTTVEETTTAQQTEAQAPEEDEISEDAAIEIALKDAGLTESDVDYSNAHLDYDDGRKIYEVDFRQGSMEYDYDIDAYTGEILEHESEVDND